MSWWSYSQKSWPAELNYRWKTPYFLSVFWVLCHKLRIWKESGYLFLKKNLKFKILELEVLLKEKYICIGEKLNERGRERGLRDFTR